MMGYGMMGGYGFGLLGLIFNMAVIVGIVILIVWAVRRFSDGMSVSGGQTPREILQVRYAGGEITRDEYQKMLKELG
jgi:putative membrane protein